MNKTTQKLRVLMAQQNYTVGAIESNATMIMDVIKQYQNNCDLIIFPELSITGYPPEDWLFRKEFQVRVDDALKKIEAVVDKAYVIVGHPLFKKEKRFNVASVFHQGKIIEQYCKHHLPNDGIFDEKRYFESGDETCVFSIHGIKIGLVICEDLWHSGPWGKAVDAGAELLVSPNASPFERHKLLQRENIIRLRQKTEGNIPIVYVNTVGGQDELVFDGRSFVMGAKGEICAQAKAFESDLVLCDFFMENRSCVPVLQREKTVLSDEAIVYQALVLGTRDYVKKTGFKGVLVGLSGGIDSALTVAIAVDALGSEHVEAVMMPSRYTLPISLEDARAEAEALQVNIREISIEPAFEIFLSSLNFDSEGKEITKQNIQARCRGLLLMALSNETGKIVLTTSNKSETAVGYATLYGDMCGGLAVLKDVLKTWVYRLAHYRNSLSAKPVIPWRVLERAPTAELAFEQTDQDSLPSYDVLDNIIEQYVELKKSPAEIIASGINADIVHKMIRLFHLNEYKRRQSAPGIKISACAFGRDWRYPITCGE